MNLEERRVALGMIRQMLAAKSEVCLPVVCGILDAEDIEYIYVEFVRRVARVLGFDIAIIEVENVEQMKVKSQAHRIVNLVRNSYDLDTLVKRTARIITE